MNMATHSRLLLLIFLSFLRPSLSYYSSPTAANTISHNASLSSNHTIVSSDGTFALGFFTPGNSSKFYLGIWYHQIPTQTIVWVANRQRPIYDKSAAELRIQNGNMVLLNGSRFPIWSTGLKAGSQDDLQAVLHDTGNLVLRRSSKRGKRVWQSFDNLAHAWLPGCKIGVNYRTGRRQILTSWRNSEDPSPGLFSLEIDPSGSSQFFILWNRSRQYWTTGLWNGHYFGKLPEMKPGNMVSPREGKATNLDLQKRLNYIYNFSYVSNVNERYFIYTARKSQVTPLSIMDVSGQIKQGAWLNESKQWNMFWTQPLQQCQVYGFCGPFASCNQNSLPFCNCLKGFHPKSESDWGLNDHSGGCVRDALLNCGEEDGFLTYSSVQLPDHPLFLTARSAAECESRCLSNCSCVAYSYDHGGCSFWIKDLLNTQQLSEDGSGKTLFLRLAASELPKKKTKKTNPVRVALGSFAGVLVLVVGTTAVFFLRRKWNSVKAVEGSLVAYGYKDLQAATRNFSEKLGSGAFGSVFKGAFSDSTVVAVKKLDSMHQGEKQFRTEVNTIGTVQHVNLVRLHGFCSEGTQKLLVYDYMSNGSLDAHLFHEDDSKVLDWKKRFQIALGTARGIAYLHEKCRDCIIHCDIKPENILLDVDFSPKVADFGLAKLFGRDFSRVLTTIRGTRGYLAPEWISGVAITAKVDVYSFGMMLFEVISGRRNSEASKDDHPMFFPYWVANLLTQSGDVLSLVDHRLEGNADTEEVARCCRVACWCIQDDEACRPSMSRVVQILEKVCDVKVPPIPKFLQLLADTNEEVVFFTVPS